MRSAKKYARAAIRVATTNIRLFSGKLIHGKKLSYSPLTCLAFTDSVELSRLGSIIFGKGLHTRGRCLFNVQESGSLKFGHDVFLNSGCQFNCRDSIVIGDGCEFGPNVLVYDHDHDFREGIKNGEFIYGPVRIGKNVWIGANSIILRGSRIEDGAVVAAGSVVKGIVPAGSVLIQKRSDEIVSIHE